MLLRRARATLQFRRASASSDLISTALWKWATASSSRAATSGSTPRSAVRLRVVGPDFNRLLKMGNGLIDLPAARQGQTPVEVGRRVVGLDFNRLLEMGNGLIDLPAARQGQAQLLWASA